VRGRVLDQTKYSNRNRLPRKRICEPPAHWGLAEPTHFVPASVNWMPHPWRLHGWAAMPTGSGDFADVKLRFLSLVDENRSAFAIGVMSEAAP